MIALEAEPSRSERMQQLATWLVGERFCSIGWAPMTDGKGPRRPWKSDATDDPALVPGLLHGARNALVIPTGRAVVIDIDDPDVWADLEAAGLPRTFRVTSPTEGHGHVYGRVPDGVDMHSIPGTFAGGEVRRWDPTTETASMVLGPWSRTDAGVYEPVDNVRVIAELPAGVLDYLRTSARQQDTARAAAQGPDDPGWAIAEGRHDYLVGRARWLRGNGLTGERLLDEVIRLDRDRCRPPLADVPGRGVDELRRIVDWVMGNIADDPAPVRLVTSPPSASPVTAPAATTALRYWTAADLAAITLTEPDWLVRGYLALQAITELDGKIKRAGKTTWWLALTHAVLEGRPFMGCPTRRARVIYVTEQQPQTFMDAIRRGGLAARGDELRIVFRRDLARLDWPDAVAQIRNDACRDGYELVIFDTIGKLSGIADENDNAKYAASMAPLQDAAHDGLAIGLARHDRKGGGEVSESGRGASSASGDVDIILQLRRPEGNQPGSRRVLESASRYPDTPEKVVIELGPDGYSLLGSDEAVAASDARQFVSSYIAASYGRNETGVSSTDLVEAGKEHDPIIPRTTIHNALSALEHEGRIVRSGSGKRGSPYTYTLRETDSSITSDPYRDETNSDPHVDLMAEARRIFADDLVNPESAA